MSLYELVLQSQELDALMDDQNVSEEALLDAIDQHAYDLAAEGVKLMEVTEDMKMRQLTAKAIAKTYYDEYKRYNEEAKRQENRRERLMGKIRDAMKAMGEKIIPAGKKEFFLRKNGGKPKLIIPDATKVPLEYCKTPEPDNEKIRAYLETLPENIECGWARLEQGEHVEIRAGK